MPDTNHKKLRRTFLLLRILALLWASSACVARGQDWVWTRETVDTKGVAMSLAADHAGNIHISYGGDDGLRYGYRSAGSKSQWFTMALGGGVHYTNIKTDDKNNPHMCATQLGLPLRYFHYDKNKWDIQEIAPEDHMSVQFQCSVAVGSDGTPHLAWYRLPGGFGNNHIRYATLKDGVWLVRTLDFDEQSGKWNWAVVDGSGNPSITYDAFIKGVLKFAHWEGKEWKIQLVDYRGAHGNDYSLGMGNSLVYDAKGNPHISYYTDTELRFASREGDAWKVETVDSVQPTGAAQDYRTSVQFDRDGVAHISYEDFGALKHAYKVGNQWHIQVIAPRGAKTSRYNSMAIDLAGNIIYIAYQDPVDGSVKVAVGHKSGGSETAADQQSPKN